MLTTPELQEIAIRYLGTTGQEIDDIENLLSTVSELRKAIHVLYILVDKGTRDHMKELGLHHISDWDEEISMGSLKSLLSKNTRNTDPIAIEFLTQLMEDLSEQLEHSVPDGAEDPAEETVRQMMEIGEGLAETRFTNVFRGNTWPDYRKRGLLLLLSKMKLLKIENRETLIGIALDSDDIRLREAALLAVPNWGDDILFEILWSHEEPDPYLSKEIDDLLAEMS